MTRPCTLRCGDLLAWAETEDDNRHGTKQIMCWAMATNEEKTRYATGLTVRVRIWFGQDGVAITGWRNTGML